ncbi:unnamed protein product, partial [Prorocentrum cordatum]
WRRSTTARRSASANGSAGAASGPRAPRGSTTQMRRPAPCASWARGLGGRSRHGQTLRRCRSSSRSWLQPRRSSSVSTAMAPPRRRRNYPAAAGGTSSGCRFWPICSRPSAAARTSISRGPRSPTPRSRASTRPSWQPRARWAKGCETLGLRSPSTRSCRMTRSGGSLASTRSSRRCRSRRRRRKPSARPRPCKWRSCRSTSGSCRARPLCPRLSSLGRDLSTSRSRGWARLCQASARFWAPSAPSTAWRRGSRRTSNGSCRWRRRRAPSSRRSERPTPQPRRGGSGPKARPRCPHPWTRMTKPPSAKSSSRRWPTLAATRGRSKRFWPSIGASGARLPRS